MSYHFSFLIRREVIAPNKKHNNVHFNPTLVLPNMEMTDGVSCASSYGEKLVVLCCLYCVAQGEKTGRSIGAYILIHTT